QLKAAADRIAAQCRNGRLAGLREPVELVEPVAKNRLHGPKTADFLKIGPDREVSFRTRHHDRVNGGIGLGVLQRAHQIHGEAAGQGVAAARPACHGQDAHRAVRRDIEMFTHWRKYSASMILGERMTGTKSMFARMSRSRSMPAAISTSSMPSDVRWNT